jgi:hypothetical protein
MPEVRLSRTAALLGAGAEAIAGLALLWLFGEYCEDERHEDERGRELHVEDRLVLTEESCVTCRVWFGESSVEVSWEFWK